MPFARLMERVTNRVEVTVDPDRDLMLRVASKDAAAYRELVARHLDRCVKVAERVLGNRQDAEDVTQEACLKIWNEAPRWEPRAKFSTWLYRVVLNACLDRRRRRVEHVSEAMDEIPDGALLADERMMAHQRRERVRQALQALPDRQRMAIVLSYYEGLSNQESADAMALDVGAFQQLLFRARQGLKDRLLPHIREA